MTAPGVIRLRRSLSEAPPAPVWPTGLQPVIWGEAAAADAHLLLSHAYAGGEGDLAPIGAWWPSVAADSEFDPQLLFGATDRDGRLAGVALGWSKPFIKDVAVRPDQRRRGIGSALLRSLFRAYHERGAAHVDLKVRGWNAPAIALYRREGMVEVTGSPPG